jgi:type I restriction-modification system DNA methylase subunit
MKSYLSDIKSEDELRNLFIEKWNWESPQISSTYFDFPDELSSKIDKCTVLAQKTDYKIFFVALQNTEKTERQIRAFERKIITQSDFRKNAENSILIFSISNFEFLDFVKPEKIGPTIRIKRFSINPENREKIRTPSEQLEKLEIQSGNSPSQVKDKIYEAFSIESVTERFYKGYLEIFDKIKKLLIKQADKEVDNYDKQLRDYIHRTLNRIMFIYFVQKRECFGGDKNFLANFWDAYKNKYYGKNEFHKKWLNILFFEGLAKPSWHYLRPTPEYLGEFNTILKEAPYLNGGLFNKEDEFKNDGWQITDELFDEIFEFFESYNFTVTESTALEIDIAIDPEMLGNIYEQLVNTGEQEEQSKAGIFYTPKTEIELMVRRSLVEFLSNKTKISKEKLYQFVFKEAGEEAKLSFNNNKADEILTQLNQILILDPACGSGHYLVATAQILYELKKILCDALGKKTDKYDEKKKIIEHNIYGNDIKEWAVNVAKLRLWLDLFVDAEEELLRTQTNPILPNLKFKIRCGDSLVQRISNELIALRKFSNLSSEERIILKEIQKNKVKVYKNEINPELVINREKDLLFKIVKRKKIEIQQEIQSLSEAKHKQNIWGDVELDINQQKVIEKNEQELNFLNEFENHIRSGLSKNKEIPMIWDLAFAEVFQMKRGFDIVIANPPYVRQEAIEDLTEFYLKNEYKEKLIQQIRIDWSYNYEGKEKYRPDSRLHPIPQKFDRKSDLYVYFYLKGLKLLNPDGVLCYISSNSWLDVGYGAKMQEILLKNIPIVAIYDNQAKRSFKHADVNTIIAIFQAPKNRESANEIKNNEVSFVMFKKPFEEVLYSEIFIELEDEEGLKDLPEGRRRENEIYRLHKVKQSDLYEFGKDKESQIYAGSKWGGKYLRAPDIYWKILEKGKDKLVRLGDIADVRRGFTTGANEFFYLEDVTDKVEEG